MTNKDRWSHKEMHIYCCPKCKSSDVVMVGIPNEGDHIKCDENSSVTEWMKGIQYFFTKSTFYFCKKCCFKEERIDKPTIKSIKVASIKSSRGYDIRTLKLVWWTKWRKSE